MKSQTEAEARVLLSLLGSGSERQTETIRRSSVPRSTFTVVRQRALGEGWIYERGIPSPWTGFSHILFVLAHPFMESVEEVGRRWEAEEGAVLLWQSPELLFATFFVRTEGAGTALARRLEAGGGLHDHATWLVATEGPHVPVYFDYEGVWGHVVRMPTTRYPRPLGPGSPSPGDPSPGLRGSVREVLRRPFRPPGADDGVRRFGPAGFPRSWRRLIARGWVEWRALPDFARIPPYEGTQLTRLVMLHGDLREGKSPVELFSQLVGGARVCPFLYVVEGRRLLLGALGKREGSPVESRERPVFRTLEEHLVGIRITTCDLGRLTVRLDHRYDRLFPT